MTVLCKSPLRPQPTPHRRDGVGERHRRLALPFYAYLRFASGRIDIVEVWGTRPRIEVGGYYLVRGKYKLPPSERRGKLYFFVTASGAWGAAATPIHDLQTTTVDKQEGEFTLVHGMGGTGYFHLVLSDEERYSRMFANVYFGTGDNVLRKKTW